MFRIICKTFAISLLVTFTVTLCLSTNAQAVDMLSPQTDDTHQPLAPKDLGANDRPPPAPLDCLYNPTAEEYLSYQEQCVLDDSYRADTQDLDERLKSYLPWILLAIAGLMVINIALGIKLRKYQKP